MQVIFSDDILIKPFSDSDKHDNICQKCRIDFFAGRYSRGFNRKTSRYGELLVRHKHQSDTSKAREKVSSHRVESFLAESSPSERLGL